MSENDLVIARAARAIADPASRRAYLDRACGGETALRARVEALLGETESGTGPVAAGSDAPATLEPSTLGGALRADDGPLEGPGTRLGPYTLLQRIGEGGFGTVFLAAQEKPVVRQVALKILKPGMDTRRVVARFELERQSLARMDHPHIARVLDAGATESGRPYFVMDLVDGEPITDYCDRHELPIAERLELFAQVCHAVQHAHTKGVIHRDIKPSNVLVSTHDGRPHAKVIDFGIAKATAGDAPDATLLTEHLTMIGTPEYMSPEQAEGSLDIDTRTDVYSLGVLLYELVTGTTPFSGRELRVAGVAEIYRILCQVDPPSPSSRLGQSRETLVTVAAKRRTVPKRLSALLRGELDWMVMRALEKDRQRRYATANDFAADIQRYLAGEPVVAAPPSAVYRLGKLVRRHRGVVVAGSAVGVALLVGAIAFAWQARVASGQRDRAVTAEAEARRRADELQKVSEFQAAMLRQVDPTAAGQLLSQEVTSSFSRALERSGLPARARAAEIDELARRWQRVNATDVARDLIDRTILRPAVAAIDAQFADQPVVDARLRQSLAVLYKNLALYEAAQPLQERALAIRRRLLGDEHAETLESQGAMGDLLRAQGKLAEAEPFVRSALAGYRRLLGEDHLLTLAALNNMGYLLHLQGKSGEAEPLLREALERQRRVLGPDHRDTLTSLTTLGSALQSEGRLAEAEAVFGEALAGRRRALGEEHPDTLAAISNLANLLMAVGRFAEAETLLTDSVARSRRVLGEDQPDTISAIANLSFSLQHQGKLAVAEPYLREALEKWTRVLGPDHPDTITGMNNLGILLQDENKLDAAEPYLREAAERRRRVLGEDHPDTLGAIGNVGRLLQAAGRFDEAETFLREALEKKRRLRGEEHPDTLTSINNYGALLQAEGRPHEAEKYFREAMEKCRRVLGEDHPNTLITTINTGSVLEEQGDDAGAVKLLSSVEARARQAFTGAYARWLAKLLKHLGRGRAGLGEVAAAEANLLEARSTSAAARGEEHKDTHECTQALVDFYTARNAAEPGKGYDAKAASWAARLAPGQGSSPASRR